VQSPRYRVGIVVHPDYGEHLRTLAARMHVWVADTPVNRAVAERLWAERPTYSAEAGVTTFRVDAGAESHVWAASVLGAIQDHHGEYSHDPPVDAVEIHGAVLTGELRAALAAHGFTQVEQTGDALLASIPPAA
jgi:hypothetical protein